MSMSTVKCFPAFGEDSSNKTKLDIGNKILAYLKEKAQTHAELMQDPGTGDEGPFLLQELSYVGLIEIDQISMRYRLTRKGLDYLDSMN